jgi:hypothetical protein
VHNGSGAHPASYPVGTRGSFPGSKAARAWSWPLTSIQCRGQRMRGAVPLLPNTPSWRGAELKARATLPFTILILSNHIHVRYSECSLSFTYSGQILYEFLVSPTRTTCAAHLINRFDHPTVNLNIASHGCVEGSQNDGIETGCGALLQILGQWRWTRNEPSGSLKGGEFID